MASIDKAADVIGGAIDPWMDANVKSLADCDAALGSVKQQISDLERDLQRARLLRDELSVKFQALAKQGQALNGSVKVS